MFSINYWRTQWVLKKKWLFNAWPTHKSEAFQKFVILCDPRTGSTFLHTLFNSHPMIQSYGEVLSERDVSKGLKNTIWRPHHQSIKAVGCKIFHEQLVETRFGDVLDEIVSDRSIKIIDLHRENKLEMFVSLKLAQLTGVWSTNEPIDAGQKKVSVDQGEFDAFQKLAHENRKTVLDQLSHHSLLSIAYDNLHSDLDLELMRLQQFVGVVPAKLFSLLAKQARVPLREIVDNYDDFVRN